MPTAQDAMIERAARRAAARAERLRHVVGYDYDDAVQDGRIGAWQALGRAEACADDEHRTNLLALAAYRKILAGRTMRWDATAGGERNLGMAEATEPVLPDSAAELVAVGQALAAIERMRTPLPRVAAMLIEGYGPAEIGMALGVSAERICQHRSELQDLVSSTLETRQ